MNNEFDSFIGNEEIKNKLAYFIDHARFPNAVLISGEGGVGKTTLARIVSRALLCSGEARPCGKCRDCVLFDSGNHPDFRELTGAGKSGAILIDAVREVIADSAVIPHRANCKVYLIEQADKMTIQAQNALLKVLEEPPSYVVFILTCLDKSTLLKTVLSRVTELRLTAPQPDAAVRYLLTRFPDTPEIRLTELAHATGGNIGRCVAALSEGTSSVTADILPSVVKGFTRGTEYELMLSLSPLSSARDELPAFLKVLKELARDALILRACAPDDSTELCVSGMETLARQLADSKNESCLIAVAALCDDTRRLITQNVYYPLLLTDLCAKLWETGKLGDSL